MKIGILTFSHTSNYGAILQAYALQQTLDSHGAQSELVDYTCEHISKMHSPHAVWKRKGILNKCVAPLLAPIYEKRLKRFLEFEEKYCHTSPRVYNKESIKDAEGQYDRFVVGSDQVWSMDLTNGDTTYFLDFVEESQKKYSYAASLGAEALVPQYEKECVDLLNAFSMISIREKTTAIHIAGQLNREVHNDLDPTLLLEQKEWMKFIVPPKKKRDYILLYMVPRDKKLLDTILNYANEMDCDVYWIIKGFRGYKNIKRLNTISPEEFLSYIYHAKYVVTGSFHAVSFSVIFQKDFWVTTQKETKRGVRILDLLSELGISNRTLISRDDFEKEKVNYEVTKERLEALRGESLKNIKSLCKENRES